MSMDKAIVEKYDNGLQDKLKQIRSCISAKLHNVC